MNLSAAIGEGLPRLIIKKSAWACINTQAEISRTNILPRRQKF